ncbi:hypothetical protein RHECNPAF_4460060 [Rhizobium etli CNPAF512]|nr:hypothetical protein RHECNPAF_4460060 [Rhizobium etli CNPAF512]
MPCRRGKSPDVPETSPDRVSARSPGKPSLLLFRLVRGEFRQLFGIVDQPRRQRIDQQRAGFEVDFQHRGFREGDQHRALARTLEFQEIAGAEIEDAGDRAVADALVVPRLKSFEIGIVELVVLQFLVGQIVALDIEFQAVQGFRGVAVVDAAETDHHDILHLADFEHFEAASVHAVQMAVVAECGGVSGVGLGAHFAAQALCAADRRHQNGVFELCHGFLHVKPERQLLINEVRVIGNENGRHVAMPPVRWGKVRLFRGVGSSSGGVSGLLSLFGGAFLGALARLCLDRVVLGFALGNAGFIEEAQNAVGRLGAVVEPVLDALGVQLNALLVVLGEHRVPGTEVFEEAAVTRAARIGENDVVVRALLGATAGETNFQCHVLYSLGFS